MARKKQKSFVWQKDFVGLWLFIVEDNCKTLVTERPIIDVDLQQLVQQTCKEANQYADIDSE